VVQLKTPKAIVNVINYALANPVAAGLIRYACEWPGAKRCVADLAGGRMRAARPDYYFDAENKRWSDDVEFELKGQDRSWRALVSFMLIPPSIKEEDAYILSDGAYRNASNASARLYILRSLYKFAILEIPSIVVWGVPPAPEVLLFAKRSTYATRR
jgi:hypothetical protein